MQKVIGLDIGSYSIKAVEIVNTFKSYEITNFFETLVPYQEGVAMETVIPGCMEQLFRENNLSADRIVTAMPGQFISSRILSFNFSDARKIQMAVQSEVEDAVPFNMDDMIIDHHILGTNDDKTTALVVMTRKAFLRNFLELLQRINIDPKLVDVDSLAFYNLSSYMNVEPGQSFAMVDIGHEKTSVCVVRDGLLRMFRSINLGGRYITEFLARDLEVGFHEAQRVKHETSRIMCVEDQATELKGLEKMIVERSTLAAGAIIKELGRTFYAYKTWDKAPLTQVFLSGGTSVIKNLDLFIKDQLEVTAVPCRLDNTTLKIGPEITKYASIVPQSVAIGLRTVASVKRHSQINLRRGEFAYVQNYETLLKSVVKAAKVVAVAVVMLIVSYGFQYYFYSRQIEALQTQYQKDYSDVFPDNTKKKPGAVAAPVVFRKFQKDAEAKLKKEIESKRSAIDAFVLENTGVGSLTVLKQISEHLPKDLKVDITMFDFKLTGPGEGKLQLRGETDSYDTQASIVEALKKVPSLKDVEEKGAAAKPGTNNSVIDFTVNATFSARSANKTGA